MKKPIGAEIRDQVLHAICGGILAALYSASGVGLVYVVPLVLVVGLVREWIQHKSIYLPRGGSLVDIIFFGVGSFIVCLIIGGILWITRSIL